MPENDATAPHGNIHSGNTVGHPLSTGLAQTGGHGITRIQDPSPSIPRDSDGVPRGLPRGLRSQILTR